MKAILEFNIDEPDDREAHLRAVKALDMALVLEDIFQELRKDWKYSDDEKLAEIADNYREKFYLLCEARGINLDELVS